MAAAAVVATVTADQSRHTTPLVLYPASSTAATAATASTSAAAAIPCHVKINVAVHAAAVFAAHARHAVELESAKVLWATRPVLRDQHQIAMVV